MFNGISQYEITHMENLMVRDEWWDDGDDDIVTLCDINECADCRDTATTATEWATTMATASTKAASHITKDKETNMSTTMKTSASYIENPHKRKSAPGGAPSNHLKCTPPEKKIQGGKN